jgi:hypothetical protein
MMHPHPDGPGVKGASRSVSDYDVEDLRGSTRFRKEPGTDFAVVWQQPGDELLLEVYDESLTGICLVAPEAGRFSVGSEVWLAYHAQTLHGSVRHVTPREDGVVLVGLATHAWPGEDDDRAPS